MIIRWCGISLALLLVMVALLSYLVESAGVPPRTLAAYVEHRAAGHNSLISGVGNVLGHTLRQLDRGSSLDPLNLTHWQASVPAPHSVGQIVLVASATQAIQAISAARPGDIITFLPGHYLFTGKSLPITQPGMQAAGIVVRAAQPDTVFLEFDMQEGFWVSAPYWTFENLNIRGVCRDHSRCEHAFHVVAGAANFSAKNNYLSDFNAHFKINGADGKMPDNGLIEGNRLSNASVRHTANPVTPVDLVAASHWIIRRNFISDFIKGEGDQISYGAFAKGAGASNRFEQNIVICEQRLRGQTGQRVGLSLGGGGTDQPVCRDKRCITEQDGGVIQSNLIASCSDDGIYLNRAATSQIAHNTLLDTGGIVVRYPESSADVAGNLVDGVIRSRDGGLLRESDNTATSMTALYLGQHPVRDLFVNASQLNLVWRGDSLPRSQVQFDQPDLCGGKRPAQARRGAFEDYAACQISLVPQSLHTP